MHQNQKSCFKIALIDFASNTVACGVGELGQALDLPVPVTIMLSLVSGISVSVLGTKMLFKNPKGVVIGEVLLDEDELKNVGRISEGGLENGPYIKDGKPNGRPTLSGDAKLQFEKDVYSNNVDPDGILRDPNTGDIINWKPGEDRKDVVDFGHNQGSSYSEMFQKYKNRQITLEELKEFQFDPYNYRLETPSVNRSHLYE